MNKFKNGIFYFLLIIFLNNTSFGKENEISFINIESDQLINKQDPFISKFIGNVYANDKMNHFWGDEMIIKYDKEKKIESITILNNVKLIRADEEVVGNLALYYPKKEIVEVIGDVIVTKGDSVLKGEKLIIDLISTTSIITGNKDEQVSVKIIK